MNRFQLYIHELLLEFNCVVVPDLGGFLAQPVASTYSEEKKQFFPPSRNVLFNKNLKANDGLVIRKVAETENISYAEAQGKVTNLVIRMKDLLNEGQSVEFPSVGTIWLDEEGNILYRPVIQAPFRLDSYGLPVLQVSPLRNEPVAEKIKTVFADRPAAEPVRTGTAKRKKYWPALMLIPSAALVIWVSVNSDAFSGKSVNWAGLNPFKPREYVTTIKVPAPAAEVKKEVHETATPAAETPAVDAASEKSTAQVTPATPEATPEAASFHIIAGCFKSRENAEKLIASLQAKGLTASVVGQSPEGLFRVALSSHGTRQEAESALLVAKNDHPSSWILDNQ